MTRSRLRPFACALLPLFLCAAVRPLLPFYRHEHAGGSHAHEHAVSFLPFSSAHAEHDDHECEPDRARNVASRDLPAGAPHFERANNEHTHADTAYFPSWIPESPVLPVLHPVGGEPRPAAPSPVPRPAARTFCRGPPLPAV